VEKARQKQEALKELETEMLPQLEQVKQNVEKIRGKLCG